MFPTSYAEYTSPGPVRSIPIDLTGRGQEAFSTTWGQPVTVRGQKTDRYNSDVSTADTIRIMRRYAHQYAQHPAVQQATLTAISRGATSQRDIACAIFYWVRGNVVFVSDEQVLYSELGVAPVELDKELLIVPPLLLAMPTPAGDCDDFSLLVACMLLCAGIEPFWVTVAADPQDPRTFSHIYICAYLADEDSALPLDPGNRLPAVSPGWESTAVTRKAIWRV